METMISILSDIHPGARIAEDVTIGPFCVIASDVVIESGTDIGAHVTIMNGVRIGKNCNVHAGAVLGGLPQDLKYKGEYSLLQIGNNVTIREYCTLNKGTADKGRTVIKDNVFLMAYVHVAHDCTIGNNVILSNSVNLAGHIEIGDHAIIGGMSAVHQFVKIGDHAFVGGGSMVRKDVPPFIKVAREPLAYAGVNSIGLKRRGFAREDINTIQDIYRLLFIKPLNTRDALRQIEATIPHCEVKIKILDFIQKSDRGLMKGFRTN